MRIFNSFGFYFQVLQRCQHLALTKASLVLIGVGFMLTMLTGGQGASPSGQVQEITGYLEPGEREVYHLPNLKRGDRLFVYMERLSGNLDPLFAVADSQ